jgi:S1-C subfamily serine protease
MMIIKGIGRNMKVIVVGIDIIVDLAVLEGTGKKEREEKVTQQEGDLVDMAIIAGSILATICDFIESKFNFCTVKNCE